MKPLLHPATTPSLSVWSSLTAGALLVSGPESVGKCTLVMWLIRRELCPANGCEECVVCRQLASGTHPNLILLVAEDRSIGIEQVQSLQRALSLTPHSAGRRFVLIDGADLLTLEAQNCLLKVLEEPPPQTLLVLLSSSPQGLLETIHSRCSRLRVALPQPAAVADYLYQLRPSVTMEQANTWVNLSGGRVGLAIRLAADDALRQYYENINAQAQAFLTAELFERLQAASRLSQLPRLGDFLEALTAVLRRSLRQQVKNGNNSLGAISALEALTSYSRRREANVSSRNALEALALEIA